MSESLSDSKEPKADVINFPHVMTREFAATDLTDEEILDRVTSAFTRKEVLDTEEDMRSRFIVNALMESLEIVGNPGDMITENGGITQSSRRLAQQSADVQRQLRSAEEWFRWHSEHHSRRETADKISDDLEVVRELWRETSFNRAFEALDSTIVPNRRDKYASAVIHAHRLAIIMMAQATEGYDPDS